MGSFIIVAGGVGQDAFAFHLLHGALGVTFDRTCSSLLLTPQLYSQTDEIDFFDFLEAKYGSITLISVGSTDVQFFAKADWCYKNGDYSTAARLFTRGIRKTSVRWTGGEPNPDYCYGSLSECLSDQNQEIKVPVADVQILSTVLQMRGTCRVMQMLPSLALIDYEESVTLNSENWAAYYGMSQAYWMLGNPERAIESALRSHDLHPSDDIRNTCIQLLVALGRGSEAVRRFGSL